MTILFFDTETTGVKSWKDPSFVPQLVQIGAILYDTEHERVVAEINFLNGDVLGEIPKQASDVHGITSDLCEKYGWPKEALFPTVTTLFRCADRIVAHNIEFDIDILKDNIPIVAEAIDRTEHYCTMEHARDIVKVPFTEKQLAYFKDRPDKRDGDYKGPHLMETYEHFFGRKFDGAHDAMADVRACMDVYFAIEKEASK